MLPLLLVFLEVCVALENQAESCLSTGLGCMDDGLDSHDGVAMLQTLSRNEVQLSQGPSSSSPISHLQARAKKEANMPSRTGVNPLQEDLRGAACPTSACCEDFLVWGANGSPVQRPPDTVWVALFAGWESCFTSTPGITILEEQSVLAQGWCMTWNKESADGMVHAQFMHGAAQGSCMLGTAWRISKQDYGKYTAAWDKMVPPYPSIPINVTTRDGSQLRATVLVAGDHVAPNEIAPTDFYVNTQWCEMSDRHYCKAYVDKVKEHFGNLSGKPKRVYKCNKVEYALTVKGQEAMLSNAANTLRVYAPLCGVVVATLLYLI